MFCRKYNEMFINLFVPLTTFRNKIIQILNLKYDIMMQVCRFFRRRYIAVLSYKALFRSCLIYIENYNRDSIYDKISIIGVMNEYY